MGKIEKCCCRGLFCCKRCDVVFFNSCRRDASNSMELRGVSLDAVGHETRRRRYSMNRQSERQEHLHWVKELNYFFVYLSYAVFPLIIVGETPTSTKSLFAGYLLTFLLKTLETFAGGSRLLILFSYMVIYPRHTVSWG